VALFSHRAAASDTGTWPPPDRYHVAVGGRISAGSGGFDTELGSIFEGYARYQWLYGLGLQASYFAMEVGNNEAYETFKAKALTLGPSWHPLRGYWVDPFVEAHVVGFVSVSGRSSFDYTGGPGVSRTGVEGVLGLQLASRYVAGGLHLRAGTTNHA